MDQETFAKLLQLVSESCRSQIMAATKENNNISNECNNEIQSAMMQLRGGQQPNSSAKQQPKKTKGDATNAMLGVFAFLGVLAAAFG